MKALMMILLAAGLICPAGASGQAAPAGQGQGTFFSSADTNGDGYLSKEEFLAVVPQAGEEGFRFTDRDGDGKISHQEFAEMPGGRGQGPRPRHRMGPGSQTPFKVMDADQDGELTYPEVRTHLPGLSRERFLAADTDGNGKLSHAEWAVFRAQMGMGGRRRGR